MKGKSKFTIQEVNQLIDLINKKVDSEGETQKRIRLKIRNIGFHASDYGLYGGYIAEDLVGLLGGSEMLSFARLIEKKLREKDSKEDFDVVLTTAGRLSVQKESKVYLYTSSSKKFSIFLVRKEISNHYEKFLDPLFQNKITNGNFFVYNWSDKKGVGNSQIKPLPCKMNSAVTLTTLIDNKSSSIILENYFKWVLEPHHHKNEPFFDLKGLKKYRQFPGQAYSADTDTAKWYKSTIKKLENIVHSFSQKNGLELTTTYSERPSIQAGRAKIVFKDYLLIGFIPKEIELTKNYIFIKLFIHGLNNREPVLGIEIDVNKKLENNPYTSIIDEIKSTSYFDIDIDSGFKNDLNSIHEVLHIPITKSITILKEFITNIVMKNSLIEIPLNQILFGPPGTGKTYATVLKSLSIIENKTEKELGQEEFSELKKRYDNLVKRGQIVFTTFHQSMSYEDFVEGIKPQEPKKEGNPITYKVDSGIFKQISIEAKTNLELTSVKNKSGSFTPFDIAFRMLEDKIQDANLEEPVMTAGSMKKGLVIDLPSSFFSLTGISGSSIRMMNRSGNEQNTMTKSTLQKIYELPDKAEEVIKGGMIGYYKALVNLMLGWESDIKEDAKEIEEKKYVLIIDEINRGNISAIFGELITLIEESKRLGKEECIELILPYSKDTFSVPKNLYLLGTMNTADRSVEALDTALRRRFNFVEMLPLPELIASDKLLWMLWLEDWDYKWNDKRWLVDESNLLKLLGGKIIDQKAYKKLESVPWSEGFSRNIFDGIVKFEGLNLMQLLTIINKRIEKLLDKDHTIGHSYFMTVRNFNDLKIAFQNKIIPLLQEYFYGDYAKIGLVLGTGFFENINEKTDENVFAAFPDYDVESLLEKPVYHLKNVQYMEDEEFLEAINSLLRKK